MRALTDTGPLVAIVSPHDKYHGICIQTVQAWKGPLFTCWPVIAEAAWLLQRAPSAFQSLLSALAGGGIEILPISAKESGAVADIMKRYQSLRPQFADAMLVYLAHRENVEIIFTLDRRNFSVYRSARKTPFTLVPDLRL